jgi:amino acid transporter
MAQFLLITTLLSIAGLIATMVMGFLASPVHAAEHIIIAFTTTIIGLFSQSMTMFFFIGTGKEIKDKVKGDADEPAVVQRTRQFKSKTFPAAMYAMGALMITFIMGGGVASGQTPRWLHDVLSFGTLILFLRAYWVQLQAMTANADLMQRYLRD